MHFVIVALGYLVLRIGMIELKMEVWFLMNRNIYLNNLSWCGHHLTRLTFVLGFIFLSAGCKTFVQPDQTVVLIVPTRSGGVVSPISSGEQTGAVPPPVVTVEGGGGEQIAVRPTWTPLPAGTVRGECEQPAGWSRYAVQAGNTLSEIAKWSGSTVDELSEINCILDIRRIEIGQIVFVPNFIAPTNTPSVTVTPIPTETPTATETPKTQTAIDFFYVDGKDLAELSRNEEIILRWQITGPGDFVLSWHHSLQLEPVILKEGKQGEYTLNLLLPDMSGTLSFELQVFDEGGSQIEQTIEIELS